LSGKEISSLWRRNFRLEPDSLLPGGRNVPKHCLTRKISARSDDRQRRFVSKRVKAGEENTPETRPRASVTRLRLPSGAPASARGTDRQARRPDSLIEISGMHAVCRPPAIFRQ
jgi:hypothetical protein